MGIKLTLTKVTVNDTCKYGPGYDELKPGTKVIQYEATMENTTAEEPFPILPTPLNEDGNGSSHPKVHAVRIAVYANPQRRRNRLLAPGREAERHPEDLPAAGRPRRGDRSAHVRQDLHPPRRGNSDYERKPEGRAAEPNWGRLRTAGGVHPRSCRRTRPCRTSARRLTSSPCNRTTRTKPHQTTTSPTRCSTQPSPTTATDT